MKKRMILSLFVFMLSAALAACGSAKSESYDSAAAPAEEWVEEAAAEEAIMDSYYGEEYAEAEMAEGEAQAPEVNESAVSQRKLIKTVELSVETKEYDNLMVSLEKQIDELGGYIESLGAYNGSYYDGRNHHRSANITARKMLMIILFFICFNNRYGSFVDNNIPTIKNG